ncbi:unnamed protein product [Leuciscus chuanchicus]
MKEKTPFTQKNLQFLSKLLHTLDELSLMFLRSARTLPLPREDDDDDDDEALVIHSLTVFECAWLPPRAPDARSLARSPRVASLASRRVWRGARAGLAVLSATSGFRHFILPPMRAARLSALYKRASVRPANTH